MLTPYFLTYDSGLCAQCMHIVSHDDEPSTVNLIHKYMKENSYELDIINTRYHHGKHLKSPGKCDVNN